MIVEAHRDLTCHCGAAKTLRPVYLGGGIALFYCESCARDLIETFAKLPNLAASLPTSKDLKEMGAGPHKAPSRCVCGSKFPALTVSLRIGALFSLCNRCADDLAHEFRKALRP